MTDTTFQLPPCADPRDLRPWIGVSGTDALTDIGLTVARWWPGAEVVEEYLAADHTPALRRLQLHSDASVPRSVARAVGERRLQALHLSGTGWGDVQAAALCESGGLPALEQLQITAAEHLSLEGWRTMLAGPWPRLRSLTVTLCVVDDAVLGLMAAAPWPRLERLAIQLDTCQPSAAALTALETRTALAVSFDALEGRNQSLPPPEAQRWLEALALAQGEPEPQRWERLSGLLAGADDALWAEPPAAAVLAATGRWPLKLCGVDVVWEVAALERPWIQLPRKLRLEVKDSAAALAAATNSPWPVRAEQLEIHVSEWAALAGMRWGWPALKQLRLVDNSERRNWRTLAQLQVPPGVAHVDLSDLAPRWLDEDRDVAALRTVAEAWPDVQTIALGRGWWTSGDYRRDFDRWCTPGRDGLLRLRS